MHQIDRIERSYLQEKVNIYYVITTQNQEYPTLPSIISRAYHPAAEQAQVTDDYGLHRMDTARRGFP